MSCTSWKTTSDNPSFNTIHTEDALALSCDILRSKGHKQFCSVLPGFFHKLIHCKCNVCAAPSHTSIYPTLYLCQLLLAETTTSPSYTAPLQASHLCIQLDHSLLPHTLPLSTPLQPTPSPSPTAFLQMSRICTAPSLTVLPHTVFCQLLFNQLVALSYSTLACVSSLYTAPSLTITPHCTFVNSSSIKFFTLSSCFLATTLQSYVTCHNG